jgi:hypothetical protein
MDMNGNIRMLSEAIEKEFVWKCSDQRGGFFIPVSQMHTKHLFYTWLMIWNHAAPVELRIWFNHPYVFDPFYTKEYMLEAFRSMYFELKKRTDIGFKMREVITRIEANYCNTIYKKVLE